MTQDISNYHTTVAKIKKLLADNNAWYETFQHEPVRTSEEAAKVRDGYTLEQGAKAIIVKVKKYKLTHFEAKPSEITTMRHPEPAEGTLAKSKDTASMKEVVFVMLVMSADKKFDSKKAKLAVGVKDMSFATPDEVATITEGVLVGGVPPFGNLFGIEVFADPSLFANEKIIFNAGDRSFSIGMKSEDYKKIVNPQIVEIV